MLVLSMLWPTSVQSDFINVMAQQDNAVHYIDLHNPRQELFELSHSKAVLYVYFINTKEVISVSQITTLGGSSGVMQYLCFYVVNGVYKEMLKVKYFTKMQPYV